MAVTALRQAYTYVFTTGGIGPTHDDITADSIARAFGVSIDIDARAVALLRERYAEADLTPTRLRMARIPAGAALIENSVSKAPGFMIGNVIVMAGVPAIMQAMLLAVTPSLKNGGEAAFGHRPASASQKAGSPCRSPNASAHFPMLRWEAIRFLRKGTTALTSSCAPPTVRVSQRRRPIFSPACRRCQFLQMTTGRTPRPSRSAEAHAIMLAS